MHVTLKRVSQDVSLEDGDVTNFLIIELPNGSEVRALVAQETVEEIIRCQTGDVAPSLQEEAKARLQKRQVDLAGEMSRKETSETVRESRDDEELYDATQNGAVIFPSMVMGGPSVQINEVSAQSPRPQPMKNEYGYPVLPGSGNGANAQDMLGTSGSIDEDGVGQI